MKDCPLDYSTALSLYSSCLSLHTWYSLSVSLSLSIIFSLLRLGKEEMEGSKISLLSLLLAGVLMMGFISTSTAYDFYVGGSSGWVQNPSEGYNNWAERNRFQINDALVFKYKKGEDSVLVVTKEDYDSCNVSNPIQRLDGGDSVFKFDRSGAFFFISGVAGNCGKGQKLVVVVLADRSKKPSPPTVSPPPSLAPSSSPPTKPPTSSPATSPSSSPLAPSLSPSPVSSPSSSPSPSPHTSSPSSSPSPSPHISSPSPSPSSPAPSPHVKSPSPSPSPSRSSPSPSPATGATAPSPTGGGVLPPTQPPTSESSPPGSSGGPSGSETAPTPSSPPRSSSSVLTASGVSLGLVALVLGGALLG